ncbi:MAG: regulatory protein RecX [Candidatus Eisenbacteria bacterium]|nr:regulatory protein RecX [Candidatus Eisenbacteria bacterium]
MRFRTLGRGGVSKNRSSFRSSKARGKAEDEKRDSFDEAKSKALDILARRSITAKALLEKLREKGFTEKTSSLVVARLTTLGLINDLEFARAFVRNRILVSPRGFFLLKRELLGKGVPKAVAEKAISEAREDVSEIEIAEKLVEKKMRSLGGVEERRAKARVFSFLVRKGIPASVAIQVTRSKFSG